MIVLKKRHPQPIEFPRLITSGGDGNGGAIATSGTLPGDFAIHLGSNLTTTPPTAGPSGFTVLGAGIGSDESAADNSIRISCKFLTSANETIGAVSGSGGTSRAVAAVFRNVAPGILDSMPSTGTSSAGRFTYGSTTGSNWVVPAITPDRATAIVCLGSRTGGSDTAWTDLTLIRLQNTASTPSQIYWNATEAASFAGFSYAIVSSNARSACTFALYGEIK